MVSRLLRAGRDWARRHSVTLKKLWPLEWVRSARRARLDPATRDEWERYYARVEDPYGYELDEYERERYRWTIAALEGRRFHRALEVGCSIGVSTEMLAPYCDELVAVDISETAVARARERLVGHPHVTVVRCTLPEETPEGPFDLIVASDVMYYWKKDVLLDALRRFEGALAPGGSLIAVNWRPGGDTHALSGDRVHRILRKHLDLTRARQEILGEHRLERYDRV